MALANVHDSSELPSANLVETSTNPGGLELVNAKKATKTAAAYDLVELAQAVQKGDEGVRITASNKLSVIADQIKYLQEQAKQVLEKAKRDSELHHAACNMVKQPGTVYFMYERESGQKYLSIISPQEWGASVPKKYHGGFRLEMDRSWTPVDEIKDKDKELYLLDSVINSKQGLIRAAIQLDSTNDN